MGSWTGTSDARGYRALTGPLLPWFRSSREMPPNPTRAPQEEPLWSPVVATAGKRTQIELPQIPQKQAKTVAVSCDRLPEGAHGKDDVCHRLPPVAEDPLSVKEGVDLLAPQKAKSCEPEGPQDLTQRL